MTTDYGISIKNPTGNAISVSDQMLSSYEYFF